ncbi:hypothetical protein [Alloyangia pacifica]|uniref:Uncharacterized protein n=1 Tax=Alloyangia pacifica TaxID=311180 RepID=A0A1I6RK14_9RHOB|nr:hypothetical protein [Alloyangia pacifica]SDG52552.1 hypothetical protein SAMN04488245_103144 [Alloyangia pacifica]SFS64986.1 hypothetical protein SAMN04488050_103144 [Alloyangia pacifica]
MIALNQTRDDLTLAAAWCEVRHPCIAGLPVYDHVFALHTGRTRVAPMVDTGAVALAGVFLKLLGYAPLDFGAPRDQVRAALIRIEAQSNNDRAAALR